MVTWNFVSRSVSGNMLAVSGGDNKVSLWKESLDGDDWSCISDLVKGQGKTDNVAQGWFCQKKIWISEQKTEKLDHRIPLKMYIIISLSIKWAKYPIEIEIDQLFSKLYKLHYSTYNYYWTKKKIFSQKQKTDHEQYNF